MNQPAAFATRAAEVARLLVQAGAQFGQPVVAITAASEALATLALAAPAIGAPLFPLDPMLPAPIIANLIGQVGECLMVGDGQALTTENILAAASSAPMRWTPQSGPALLIATSGSSGKPKVVTLTGDNLAAAAKASSKVTPLKPGDRWLACLPLFHIGGYSILTRCALAGAEPILHQGFDAERVFHALTAEGISHLSLTPTMLAQVLAIGRPPPACLRHVLVGGAALSAALAQRATHEGWPIQPTYGMSETGSQVATLSRVPSDWRPGRVGRPLKGVDIALDKDGRLKVRGPMVMAGYANSMLTPGDGLADGWFHTSDLAEISPRGELIVLGRADEAIVSGGKKIHPASVEDLVAACPGVDAIGVVGRPDPVWGEIVIAIFSGCVTSQDLLGWCRSNMAGAFRPRAALRVEGLPTLSNGKPDRPALRRLAIRDDAKSGAAGQR